MATNNNTAPSDDDFLEMEEAEELLDIPSPSRRKAQQGTNLCDCFICERWGIVLFVIGFFLVLMLVSGNESLRLWEGNGGINMDNVEMKPAYSESTVPSIAPPIAPSIVPSMFPTQPTSAIGEEPAVR